jgi:hypothetical protein
MLKLLLAGGILIGGYLMLTGSGGLPQTFGVSGGGSSKILQGGSVVGTVAGGIKGAVRGAGN